MFGNHTRQTTIIRLLAGVVGVALLCGPAGAGAQTPRRADTVACVSCIVVQVTAQLAGDLAAAPPGTLDGLVLVVADSGTALETTLDRLATTGATVGLVLSLSGSMPSADVFQRSAVLILDDVGEDEASVYRLRLLATAARAARPGIRILVGRGALSESVAPYIDGRVTEGRHVATADVDALVLPSNEGGADLVRVTIDAVDWHTLASFAALRALGSEVVAPRPLGVAEIVARHQAQRRRQDRLVRRAIARGTTSLLFEVPGFVAPVTVTAETVMYTQQGVTEIEQRDIRVNGAPMAGGSASSPPRLPLIEPERIATPPLVLTLNETYRYSLAGRDEVDDESAYVVAFEPREPAAGLARGRAWIHAERFALVRLETIQTGLRGAIVSSEQHERFGRFRVEGQDVWLPVRTRVFQTYEGAGHRTPIHRSIETPWYDIDPPDFEERLRAAYASPHLMLRDTPQGFRYLLRDGGARDAAVRTVAARAGERIRTAVAGVLIDPSITVPLPFAGLSYVDLNLLGTGAQLNVFFGGSYGHLSWSAPSLAGTRWRAHGRAFAIAASYHDRSFRGGVERYGENIRQRPAHASVGVVRPFLGRARMRADYELDYTAYSRADTTSPEFEVPANARVHGLVAALEADWGAWTARAWWNPAVRQAGRFQRFGAVAAGTLALSGEVASRVEVAWMDGTGLDRFSRYGFGAFDNRLRGYPSAGIRYDRGAVARSVTSWSARGWRVDGFADMAVVRDPGFGPRARGYPGAGAALELAGPFRSLWSLEWGYGFRGRRSDGRLGTQALRITAYRTF